MKVSRALVGTCIGLTTMAGCGSTAAAPVPTDQTTYTCCEETDVDVAYRPGQTLTVHWIVRSPDGPPAGNAPLGQELNARLTGPYPNVDDLKAATPNSAVTTYAAAPLHPSGTDRERPVSSIAIGSDAKPGYYNLETSTTQGDATSGGASVIQVVAKP